MNLGLLRGRAKIIAIKQSFELCKFADVVYGCDPAWWRYRRGLPEFKGLKVSWRGAGMFMDFPDVLQVDIASGRNEKYTSALQFGKTGTIGGGGNSGFQAFNLSLQWGARKHLLVGFDMDDVAGKHWYGRNGWPMANNPDKSNFRRWAEAFDKAIPDLISIGADVVNCSPKSALRTFPIMTIEQALARFHAEKADAMGRV